MTSPTTKTRLLDAAEALYAEYGFAETSMRELTAAAGVNLSAVNYHFGSKEGLFRELFARRFAPINAARLAELDRLEAAGDPGLEEVLEALVAPILELRMRDPRLANLVVQIAGSLTGGKSCPTEGLGEVFRKTSERFMTAVQRCLPQVPERQQLWRLHCTISVMIGTLLDPHGCLELTGVEGDVRGERELLADIVAFLAAGLRAPVAEAREEGE